MIVTEFRTKWSISSLIIALQTPRSPLDKHGCSFSSHSDPHTFAVILVLDEVAYLSPPSKQFSTNNRALLILSSYCGVIDSCGMMYTMFSLVPERTRRITQSRTLMNAHCVVQVESKKKTRTS